MTSILFVDDEQQLLDGLQDLLRRMRRDWEMVFALGADAALAAIAERPFDIVVSDMKMPGMDGAQLLERVRATAPGTVRIVLSGQTSHEQALRAVPVAQQFISKPTDVETLTRTLRRACELRTMLECEAAREIVGETTGLPAPPEAFAAIDRILADERASLARVAAAIGRDVALGAKVLQLVNSAFFGLGRRIASIEEAVSYLGIDLVRAVVLSRELGTVFTPVPATLDVVSALDRHGVLVSELATALLPDRAEVTAAALLHDVGSLVLLAQRPREALQAIAEARRSGQPVEIYERELVGASHAEVGAYLLGLWGLPAAIVEATALHHDPAGVDLAHAPAVAAVHAADVLAWTIAPEPSLGRASPPPLDPAVRGWLGAETIEHCLQGRRNGSETEEHTVAE